MDAKANFRIAARLASLLGENYRSTQQAIRELVDNAWDADAESVRITLPEPLTLQPIIIEDDGCGMTQQELDDEYLLIAHDRRSRRGERTPRKDRPVRGRKGIGKFAGLVAAEHMRVETRSEGNFSTLEITKSTLLASTVDLGRIKLPLSVVPCKPKEHGTRIILSNLNPRFSIPSPEELRELLALEFGRFAGFSIWVNGELLTNQDIQGRSVSRTVNLPSVGPATLRFTIMDSARGAKGAGIVTRVGSKIVGKPAWFGLEGDEDLPKKLLNRVVGEIEADGLEGDVTADWGALFENSTAYKDLQDWAREQLKREVTKEFGKEVNLAKARRQKRINEQLSKIPEHRRPFAERALERVMRQFYGESEDKIDVLTFIVLEAFEKDEYWTVCQKIQDARHSDIVMLAGALQEFGLVDLAYMGEQARRRLLFLDEVDELARDEGTLESTMHRSLETNLWVFGPEFSLMASNKTLAKTIMDYTSKKFSGPRASKRPDLLLAQDVLDRYHLIEFKRPSHAIGRDDENQAEKYRDDLTPRFGTIDILVIGGKKSPKIQSQYSRNDIKMATYEAIFSRARTHLDWLLKQLTHSFQ
jgi:Histidine kinase-, DNA gyrase B-, and HSP90-like ATPase